MYRAAVDLPDLHIANRRPRLDAVAPSPVILLSQTVESREDDRATGDDDRPRLVRRGAYHEGDARPFIAAQEIHHVHDIEAQRIAFVDLKNQVALPAAGPFHGAAGNHVRGLRIFFLGVVPWE